MSVDIRFARSGDEEACATLLRAAELPVPSREDPPVEMLVAEQEGEVVACAGWETYGGHSLLRSVVVADALRGAGLGSRIVRAALTELDRLAVADVMLVTLDAAAFFARLGFRELPRNQVAASIHESPVFRIHECLGGTWMVRSDRGLESG